MLVAIVTLVFDSNDFDVPDYDMLTVVNHLDVGSLHNYFDDVFDNIATNAVAIVNNDPNAI